MAERVSDSASGAGGVLAWADLPESVRAATIEVAAAVLATLTPAEMPSALAPIAAFTPGKRAKRGAVSLARELRDNAGFRAVVAARLPAGFGADPGDPVRSCARAFLVRLPAGPGLLSEVALLDEMAELRAQVAHLTGAVDVLTTRLAHVGDHAGTADRAASAVREPAAEIAAADERVEKLRRRLREQGTRARMAADESEQGRLAALAERDEAQEREQRAQALAVTWQHKAEQEARRADQAGEALERERGAATQTRMDRDRRMSLLLDTVIDAAAGLKHEWRLATGGADPADVVVRNFATPGPRIARPVDAALLRQWLRLPGAHLIVDGYNVTKTGYAHLSLAEQRDRLTRSLGALVARTEAEVTVVFDGAAVVVPTSSTNRVRVVFSPPDVIADDVIQHMAAAEPAGRVVIVVTSDREVVDGVRRSGARVASSSVLLSALEV